MKLILSIIICILLSATQNVKCQNPTNKEYHIKYEVLTKKGEKIAVGYFDKNGNNAGATASEIWTYSFTTTDKYQNIQVFTTGGQDSRSRRGARVWTKVNIYVNDKLIKSIEEKVLGAGTTVQVNIQDIK